MKRIVTLSVAVFLSIAAGAALADEALAKAKNCMGCHTVDKKMVGPSYKDIAARHAGDKGAAAKLATAIRQGSQGVYGGAAMPPNASVSEDEAKKLAGWIVSLK